MTVEDGIILRGEAILIPPTERAEILQQIHEGHQGITKSQLRARNCVYWPGINKDIQCMIEACETCQNFRPCQSHAPLKAAPPPSRPWQRLGTDLFEFDGNDFIVIADYYSNMPFLCKIPWGQCNAAKVISILKEVFLEHGVPETLISDNGPQYSSALFAEFVDEWKFTHVTSSPHHPEGNGFAESMVKVVKQMLQHAKYSGSDPHLALLSYRATPLDSKIASPAELMYWRHLQSTLPSCLRNTAPDAEDTQEALNNRANKSKANHDCTAGPERAPFYAGQDVSVWDPQRCLWVPAKIICRTANWAYQIKTPAGFQYTCTQDHVKAHHTAAHHTPEEPEELEPPTPTAVPHTTTPTVAPATPATSDKLSVPPPKPSSAPATLARQPVTPQPAKPTPAAPTSTPVLRRSKQTIIPPQCLITEKE